MSNRKELDGLLGMYEMEQAIEVMLQKSEASGRPFGALEMCPEDFLKAGDSLVGFCHLLVRGLMAASYPNGYFKVGKSLIDLMRDRRPDVWKDLADPPTWEEWYEFKYGRVAPLVPKEKEKPQ